MSRRLLVAIAGHRSVELLCCEVTIRFIFYGSLLFKQEEMMNEEQKADPFTRRKTLPQLVSMVCVMLIAQKVCFK